MRAGSNAGPSRRARLAIAGALLIVACAAADDLRREAQVGASERAVRDQTEALARGAGSPGGAAGAGWGTAARTRANRALVNARSAAALPPGGAPQRLLELAAADVDRAVAARPLWGEVLVTAAYVHGLRDTPADAARSIETFAASYAGAPFLRDAAPWRIGYGFAHWSRLPAATRHDVIEEAIWLLAVDPDGASAVFDLARGSAAYVPFMLRWGALASAPVRPAQ